MNEVEMRAAYAGRKVLVPGGGGFIGANLVPRLEDLGARVTVIDSFTPACGGNRRHRELFGPGTRLIDGEIAAAPGLLELLAGCDLVVNLMGCTCHRESMRDPAGDWLYNGKSHLDLLAGCCRAKTRARIVYLGSRSQYGRPRQSPVREEHPLAPVDVHGAHKALGEWYHQLAGVQYGLLTVTLRVTNVYGPGQDIRPGRAGIINEFVRQALAGGELTVYGSADRNKEFVYAGDLVDAILCAGTLAAEPGAAFNVGGRPVRLLETAELATRLAGDGKVRLLPFPADLMALDAGEVMLDSSRFRAATGWEPRTSPADGLPRTMAHYRDHREWYA